jgi:hypothetical protein
MVYLGLPKTVIFHGELLNNQSVNLIISDLWLAIILIYDLWFYDLWLICDDLQFTYW